MKRHTPAIAGALGAVLSILPMQAQTKAHRVLFAMTSLEEADWQLTPNNIRNLISGIAPETVEIEAVAYGPGIAFLKKDGVDAAEIQKRWALGVGSLASVLAALIALPLLTAKQLYPSRNPTAY